MSHSRRLRLHGGQEWWDLYHQQDDLERFFDRYLKGLDNGWEQTARVRYQLLPFGPLSSPKTLAYMTAADFPPPEMKEMKLYLASEGALSHEPQGRPRPSAMILAIRMRSRALYGRATAMWASLVFPASSCTAPTTRRKTSTFTLPYARLTRMVNPSSNTAGRSTIFRPSQRHRANRSLQVTRSIPRSTRPSTSDPAVESGRRIAKFGLLVRRRGGQSLVAGMAFPSSRRATTGSGGHNCPHRNWYLACQHRDFQGRSYKTRPDPD